jgi:hypothetical protein
LEGILYSGTLESPPKGSSDVVSKILLFVTFALTKNVWVLTKCSYEHIIVGTRKSTVPPQTFGGILADEMGLGKTLTMLSAIVGSLGLAYSSTTLPTVSNCKTSAKGTLIIAPSVCKCFIEILIVSY